ncbi:hypothetical protein [Arachnia propionica]|nr:hypothetical protein [Arachnia propionica]
MIRSRPEQAETCSVKATGPSPATIGNSHGTAVDGTAFTDLGPAQ